MSTNLIEKFDAVEVTADTRIDSADRAFCQMQETAYKQARAAMKDLKEKLLLYKETHSKILEQTENRTSFIYFGKVKEDEFSNAIEESHRRFISEIFTYFERKYSVDIEGYYAEENLLPKRPSGSLWSNEEDQWEEYHKTLSDMELTYQIVVDQIFLQTEGLSFAELAAKEIKDAAHRAAWSNRSGEKEFELKNSVISFACAGNCDSNSSKKFCVELHQQGKYVLRAINHFEWGDASCHSLAAETLLNRHSYFCHSAEVDMEMEKLQSIKFFKNHRVDFRFTSEEYARQFVEEYLGTTP